VYLFETKRIHHLKSNCLMRLTPSKKFSCQLMRQKLTTCRSHSLAFFMRKLTKSIHSYSWIAIRCRHRCNNTSIYYRFQCKQLSQRTSSGQKKSIPVGMVWYNIVPYTIWYFHRQVASICMSNTTHTCGMV
jgi:hypothetical protein